jgi:uncharacterized protein YbbK (DUF523 family)
VIARPVPAQPRRPIRIGISACLLGEEVRFDGGHKRDPFLTDVLSPHVEWVRVCPEVEVGMGTPRETLRLVREGDGTRAHGHDSHRRGLDGDMVRWSRTRLEQLAAEQLSGYVLKKDSPSCGMERVKVYGGAGMPQRSGRGLFAEALLTRFPNLPVEEEGRLSDPRLRENFIERVFAYWHLGEVLRRGGRSEARRVPYGPQDGAARALDDRVCRTRPAGGGGGEHATGAGA